MASHVESCTAVESADERDIAQAYAHCRAITRERARNFYYGIRLSREPHRSAIYAVYAWMRLADDLVDSAAGMPVDELVQRIVNFRDATDASLAGHPPGDSRLWLALSDAGARFSLPAAHFHEMLEGQLDDARQVMYQTEEQLLLYCRRVASTVGLICIEIWGYRDSAARELAATRGIAFQLTNILRDLAEDHDAGRVYLPQTDFQRLGVTPDDLRNWRDPDRCRTILAMTIDRAQECYRASSALDGMIHPRGRATLWAMTTIYQNLLAKIKADPARVARGRRVRLSAVRKGAIALRAKWLSRFMGDDERHAGATPGRESASA